MYVPPRSSATDMKIEVVSSFCNLVCYVRIVRRICAKYVNFFV